LHSEERLVIVKLAFAFAELFKSNSPGAELEDRRAGEHDVVDDWLLDRMGMLNVRYALVARHARSQSEQQQCDDEAPEVEFATMVEWVVLVRRQISAVFP
jgi:hypothetical protein